MCTIVTTILTLVGIMVRVRVSFKHNHRVRATFDYNFPLTLTPALYLSPVSVKRDRVICGFGRLHLAYSGSLTIVLTLTIWHSQINLLSTPLVPHQLPSSLLHTITSMLLSNPFVIVISLHFPRRSTLFNTQPYCLIWPPNSTCQPLSTTGWQTSSAATRTIPCSTVQFVIKL